MWAVTVDEKWFIVRCPQFWFACTYRIKKHQFQIFKVNFPCQKSNLFGMNVIFYWELFFKLWNILTLYFIKICHIFLTSYANQCEINQKKYMSAPNVSAIYILLSELNKTSRNESSCLLYLPFLDSPAVGDCCRS